MPKKGFNDQDDEILVQLVSQFPILYDQRLKDFRNIRLKNKAWMNVAEALKKDEDQCKKRWKDIRDNYSKIVRRKSTTGTGSAVTRSSTKWVLFDKLAFLGDNENEPSSFRSAPELDSKNFVVLSYDKEGPMEIEADPPLASVSFSTTSEAHPISPPIVVQSSRKKSWDTTNKRSHVQQQQQQQHLEYVHCLAENKQAEDEVDLFMRSIALSVKKLPPHLVNKAKLGILSLVSELSDRSTQTTIVEEQSESL